MPTIQELDRRLARQIADARAPLIAGLTALAQGKPWHYLLFGSLARNKARRGSDADIAIVGASGPERFEAEYAAIKLCEALGLTADTMLWEDLSDAVRIQAERDGVICGA